MKKRPIKEGEHQIFAGLLKCSTCGQGLTFARFMELEASMGYDERLPNCSSEAKVQLVLRQDEPDGRPYYDEI